MGYYNATIDVSKSYYLSNSTVKSQAFFLGSSPTLSNDFVTPTSDGWGALYTFHVDITDQDQNINTVSVWKSLNGVNYTQVDIRNVTTIGGQNTSTDFQTHFTCADIGPNFYYFSTTDQFGFTANTSNKTFIMDVDDVTVLIDSDSNATVRRNSSNSALLKVRIFDTDYGIYPNSTNATIFVTRNNSLYDVNYSCSSSSGYCQTTHDPACTTNASVQYWYARTTDSCYRTVNSSNTTLTVYGQLQTAILPNFANAVAQRNYNRSFITQVIDDCSVSINDANVDWYNESFALLARNYSANWTVPPKYKLGLTTINTNASRNYFDNGTNSTPLYIHGWSRPLIYSPSNGSQIVSGTIVDVICGVADNDTQANITNYPVSFFKNGTLQQNSNASSNGSTTWQWATSSDGAGSYDISCAILNNSYLYYNTSSDSANITIIIRRQLVIDSISPDYPSIYRNNSFAPNQSNITIHVKDANIGSAASAAVWLYNSTYSLLSNCTTNSQGYCSVYFNPNENATPSTYVLHMNATKSGNEDSDTNYTTITVNGILVSNITAPLNGSFYSKTQSADLAATVLDENRNTIALTVVWTNETGQISTTTSNTAPVALPLITQTTGYRNFTAASSKSFYDTDIKSALIRISGLSDVSVVYPANGTSLTYPLNVSVSCRVFDHDSSVGVGSYNITFSYNYSGGNLTQNLTTNSSGYTNFTFSPTVKGLVSFTCVIYDDQPKFYSANINSSTVYVTELDTRAPIIHNSSIIPNQSLETNLNFTQITAAVSDDTSISSVYASINWPNGTIQNVTMPQIVNGTYAVNYTPTINGTYNVTIVAIDAPPENNANYSFAGYFVSLGKTNSTVFLLPISVIASGITQSSGYTFAIALNLTNRGPVPMYGTNLTIYDDSSSEVSYNDAFEACGTLQPNQTCAWAVTVTVLPRTAQKLIALVVNASWKNADLTISTNQNTSTIVVSANPIVDILNSPMALDVQSGFSGVVSNITSAATGNERLLNVQLTAIGGDIATLCPSCILSISPSFQGLLNAGDNFTSNIAISIPPTQPPGSFWTFIQANASGLLDTVLVNFTIPSNGSWVRVPSTFGNLTIAPNTSAIFGNISVTNNGNIKSTFTFATSGIASPYLLFDGFSVLAVDIDKQITRVVNVSYSVPASTTPGFYPGTITLLSSNGTPSSQTISIGLNITDLPPIIQNATGIPANFEITFGNSTISANVTDNFGVSSVWINVTRNGSTVQQFLTKNSTIYSGVYNSTISGNHSIKVCANDTSNLVDCSSEFNITAYSQTNLSFQSPQITISNVTLSSDANTTINLSINNLGYARALNSTFNISMPQNFSVSPNSGVRGTIYASSNSTLAITFVANAGTPAGAYVANLTINWTNLDGTASSNITQLQIIVGQNAVLNINETTISQIISAGTSGTVPFTIISDGTTNLTGITYSCASGSACSSFTVSFLPSSISFLPTGSSQQVNATVTVTSGFASGVYTGTIVANGSNNTGDTAIFSITVPSNLSWTQSPSSINAEVITGQSGEITVASVTNIGNQILYVAIIGQGNVSPYLVFNASSLLISALGSSGFQINYSAPSVSVLTNYVGNATTQNATATPPEKATFINLTVHPFYGIILSPTESAPVLNVNPGNALSVVVNATYGAGALSANVSFNVTLQDSSTKTLVSLTSQTFSSGLWTLNFTAPSLATGKSYDLNVTFFDLARRLNLTKIEIRAIGYTDTTPPQVSYSSASTVIKSSQINITINANDTGTMFQNSSAVVANITYPSGSVSTIVFNFASRSGDSYLYLNSFQNTSQIGNYTVNAKVCDASSNCNYTSGSFLVRSAIVFAGRALDLEQISQPALQPEFRLYSSANLSSQLYAFQANSSGHYNQTVFNDTYYVNASLQSKSLLLTQVPLTMDYADPLRFGLIPTTRIGAGALAGVIYYVNLTYTSSNVSFNYLGLPYSLESNLGIYSCSAYSPMSGCTLNWTRQSAFRDPSKGIITYTSTNASMAYALAEYVCGNGICEASTGESTAVCSTDCPAPNVTVTATPSATATIGGGGAGTGAGAGGGGSSAGAGGTATPSTGAGGAGGAGAGNGSGGAGGDGGRIGPPEVRSSSIDLTLKPGDKRTQVIDLVNNLDVDLLGSFIIEGDAAAFLSIEKPTTTVKSRTLESIKVLISVPDTTFPGIYTADIIVKLGNVVKITPVTLRIEKSKDPLLDVKVSVLSKVVRPGDNVRAEITIVNRGEAEAATDVSLQYTLKTLSEDKTIYTSSETVQISDLVTRSQTAKVPGDAEPGIYIFQVTATYLEGRKVSIGSDSVEVTGTSVTGLVVQTVTSSWLTYALILGIILFVGGKRAYAVYQQRKLKGQRYIIPMDYKKLPQAGPRAIPVGRIAETDVTAYFDMDKLQTHSIAAGGTGSGKSVSAQVVVEELLKRNVPVVVFDPTAQWTGYIRPNKDKQMLALYPKFAMKPEDARSYKTNIINVLDPNQPIEYKKYLIPGEITVFVMNKLQPAQLDGFVKRSIQAVFDMRPLESKELKLLIVYDEVHRLLPKYGGKGAYAQLERGYREFRKWGLGMFMISQVLLDFKGAVRANIANEIQLRTKYEGDIGRVKTKYGGEYASKITKLTIGTGLVQNPEYNEGKPWFVAFRPLLHSTFALTEEELQQITGIQQKVEAARVQIDALKAKGVDTYDVELELKIASDKLKQGLFRMSDTYLESVASRLKSFGSKR
ncbi:MAG: DUF87 domain-containing protein [Candidatus Micrarchaeota archaeon]